MQDNAASTSSKGFGDLDLDQIAKKFFRTTPVLDIQSLDGAILADPDINEYLVASKMDWVCVFDTNEVLFYPKSKDVLPQLQNLRDLLKRKGRIVKLRPAAKEVIDFARNRAGGPGSETAAQKSKDRKRRREGLRPAKEGRSDVQKLLDALISAADRAGTSDVHIETDEDRDVAVIRYRIDGDATRQTHTSLQWREVDATAMASMIINYETQAGGGSAKDSFDKRKPIDGSFTVKANGRTVKLRYSHVPTTDPAGLSIVMRIVTGSGDGTIPGYEQLGYSDVERAMQERAFRYPHGIVLYTGPTGSGKSTAMAAGVITLPETRKILAYEDPVEANLPNVSQIQVGSTESTSFASYARAALRQDPDVIIYGEIRDEEVMTNTIHQANTGHLVLSTLHTNSAPEAIQRMADLGCEWGRLGSPSLIRAIIAQRLVKKVCPDCCVPLVDAVNLAWANEDHYRLHEYFSQRHPRDVHKIVTVDRTAVNCPSCKGKGEKGRLPIVEIIILDEKGREYIKDADILGWTKYLKAQGWQTMGEKARDRILSGEVCPASVEQSLETPFGVNAETFSYTEFEGQFFRHQEEKRSAVKKRVIPKHA